MNFMHSFSRQQKMLPASLGRTILVIASTAVMLVSLHPVPSHALGHAAPTSLKGTPGGLIPADARKPAPDFTLTEADGKAVTLSNYKGKVVLLDFWATWCGGCKLEIPWYMEFDKKYKSQGLAVIGVSMDAEGWKVVRPFLAQKRDPETGGNTAMQYPVVIGNDALGQRFGLQSMPLTLLIDRKGKIAVSHAGVVNKENFESDIQELLQASAPSR